MEVKFTNKYLNNNQYVKQKKKNTMILFACVYSCFKMHNLISNYNKSI